MTFRIISIPNCPGVTLKSVRRRCYSIALQRFRKRKFKIHPKVNSALKSNLPVVALESTIITHGMPYPQNLKTAIQVEDIIMQNGALPATIAILDGKIHVGLEKEELERLASLGSQNVRKTSRRDLAMVIANKMHGATTVSGTMLIAHMAGIKVFVTGGIGGVHRGVEETMDISADLTELGRTPVAVVCAGVKSILDIGRTLEYLETQGVTVTTYGKSSDFPAFYAPSSGYKSPFHSPTIDECAALIHANAKLKLDSGIVIATPIPEKDAGDSKVIQSSIDTALQELRNKKISGKDCTPFLLSRIAELSGNVSLEANIALIKNNARIGALIAGRYSEMARGGNSTGPGASLKAERERLASETEVSATNAV
ncbi:Indigoidine synthase A like protein-domain-containing protein [Paraphysoderma sedebokerense]|nr:Indigoidine synthase A like protein-domain-containing protein [Paraphysoderma sedebokerense]